MDDPRGPAKPSGEQFSIGWKDHTATITEVGATLRDYRIGSRQVIDGFEAGEMCSGGRGQVLMPWPNRIADGSYQFHSAALNGRSVFVVRSSSVRHAARVAVLVGLIGALT